MLRLPTTLTLLLALTACGPPEDTVIPDETDLPTDPCEGITPSVTDLTADELLSMLDAKDFQLVNVHVPYAGEITQTDVHVSFQDIDGIEDHVTQDKGAKIVVYCLTGPMSEIASNELVDRGYCNVYDMPPGMYVWEQLGYPMGD